MDSVFWFLHAENTTCFRVTLQNGKRKKTQCPIRERARFVLCPSTLLQHQREELSTLVYIDPYRADAIYELGKPIGNPSVQSLGLAFRA